MHPVDRRLSLQNRVRGCLLGGAIGDALGAPVEFLSLPRIKQRFGPAGITGYAPAYGRIGAITDDTQMTLFTAEGLIRGFVRRSLKKTCCVTSVVSHSYLRWLLTQDLPPADGLQIGTDGWLWGIRELHSRRAPGNTCVSALSSMSRFTDQRASNNSKGAGTIMRVAPVALTVDNGSLHAAKRVFELAKSVSWVTHGHPSGYLAAAAFAVIVHGLLWELPLESGIDRARDLLAGEEGSEETVGAVSLALASVESRKTPDTAIPLLGEGWVAEQALAIALYCALTAKDFDTAVRMAVNHDGDSDTTGSLVGQLLGAMHGEAIIPSHWLENLELRETITGIANDLCFLPWNLDQDEHPDGLTNGLQERYPGW